MARERPANTPSTDPEESDVPSAPLQGTARRVLVSGYSTFDLVLRTDRDIEPGATSTLVGPVSPELARGGCAPRVALQLARLGVPVALVTWLGSEDDYNGEQALASLAAETEWVAVTVGPARMTERVLDTFTARLDARSAALAWNVKADRRSFPDADVRRLAGADLLCMNL